MNFFQVILLAQWKPLLFLYLPWSLTPFCRWTLSMTHNWHHPVLMPFSLCTQFFFCIKTQPFSFTSPPPPPCRCHILAFWTPCQWRICLVNDKGEGYMVHAFWVKVDDITSNKHYIICSHLTFPILALAGLFWIGAVCIWLWNVWGWLSGLFW